MPARSFHQFGNIELVVNIIVERLYRTCLDIEHARWLHVKIEVATFVRVSDAGGAVVVSEALLPRLLSWHSLSIGYLVSMQLTVWNGDSP